ncbi:DUF2927 domain-containing protein [Celeribacter sp. ASW11-22]|nr:DUF2927 domain-containing protein [Celeribacter litoreus]
MSAGIISLALSACTPLPSPVPQARPSAPGVSPTLSEEAARSTRSFDLERYYARLQADLLTRDLLRTDGGGPDAPFSSRQLAQNFNQIALRTEYTAVGGRYIEQSEPQTLRRWTTPVRLSLEFGDAVPDAIKSEDRATLTSLTRRLNRATNHPISATHSGAANFHIFVLYENELFDFAPRLTEYMPGIGTDLISTIQTMDRSTFCAVLASDKDDDGKTTNAVAVIRAELPPLQRKSCFHEEIAQGLGLTNDSPYARPSIFNDDDEFATLTQHDELLLRILYDPRLSPGMPPEEAGPIAAEIARELMGEDI